VDGPRRTAAELALVADDVELLRHLDIAELVVVLRVDVGH
jgi:hypothetical protein